MKKFISMFVILVAFSQVHAQQAMPTTLENTMKVMARDLKKITEQVSNPQLNADSMAAADEMTRMLVHSKNFIPETVTNEAQKAQYFQALDQTAQVAHQLTLALQANDNAKAAEILKQLNQARRSGHSDFKP